MGLFSKEYVTTVGTSLDRVIKDASLPNSMKTSVLKALVASEDLVDNILEGMFTSVSVRADRMYEYAERRYTHGSPSGEFVSEMTGMAEVTGILTGLFGSVSVNYSYFGPANRQHFALQTLINAHGYDTFTNRLNSISATLGRVVYLTDLRILIPEATFPSYPIGSLRQWGTSSKSGYTPYRAANPYAQHTPVYADPGALTPTALVQYTYSEPGPGWDGPGDTGTYHPGPYQKTGSFSFSLTGFNPNSNYFHAEFYSGGVRQYWSYEFGTGGYGILDGFFLTPPKENGTFFPFLYFRHKKKNQAADKTTAAYRTSKRMAKYLGLDFATVCENVAENPNIADVEQAMLMLAVPVNTTNQMERRYLFDFFSTQYFSGDNQFSAVIPSNDFTANSAVGIINTSGLVIKDNLFKMVIGNNGIIRQRIAGVIGGLGTYSSWTDTTTVTQFYLGYDPIQQDMVTLSRDIVLKVNVYARQVNLNEYDEVRVVNFKTLYYVLDAYASTTDGVNDISFVPLDRSITTWYSLQDKEELYARSLHFVFNSVVITTVKWYQQVWFQWVMLMAALVVTVCSMGADGGALVAAVVAGSTAAITAAAIALLYKILINLVISYALKLFVEAVGIKAALIIAILVVLAGGYMAMDAGSIAGAPWAQELLSLGNGLSKSVEAELQNLTGELLKEGNTFAALMGESYKELEAAQKLLENTSWLSPTIFFGETPDDFYNRTVHSGNIGVVGIGAISSYVDIALTLPKIDESVGGNSNE